MYTDDFIQKAEDYYYDNLIFDETCSMTDEEYENMVKQEQQEVDDSLKIPSLLIVLRLLKLGKVYKFNMKNVFKTWLDDYASEEEMITPLNVCNAMLKLSSTLKDEYIKYIDELYFIDEEIINCKEIEYYIATLDCYLEDITCLFNEYDEYDEIYDELRNEILIDELKYLNRKINK